jgi:hypothetical protein
MDHPLRVGVTFLAPGVKENPIPVGTRAYIDGLWRLKVLSSHLQNSQEFVVQLSATATHSESLYLYQLTYNIFIQGRLDAYSLLPRSCAPPSPDLRSLGVPGFFGWPSVLEGQTVTGYLCFVTHNDRPLLLFTEPPTRSLNPPDRAPYLPDVDAVWFALR